MMLFLLWCWSAFNSNRPVRNVEHQLELSSTWATCAKATDCKCDAQYQYDKTDCCTEKICLKGCYSAFKSNKTKESPLYVFFDFDGTLELYDDLAHDVMQKLKKGGKEKPEDGEMLTALQRVFNPNDEDLQKKDKLKELQSKFIERYFDSTARVETIKKQFKAIRKVGKVHILSAAWHKIPGVMWQEYLTELVTNPNYGLEWELDKIIGVDDPGGSKKSDKGAKVKENCKDTPEAVCIHVDNSVAYVYQSVSQGYGGVHVPTSKHDPKVLNSVQADTFELIFAMQKKATRDNSDHKCNMPPYDSGMAWGTDGWKEA